MTETISLATLKQWLLDAETAFQTLVTKGGVARIREGEKWIEYHPADVARLEAYVAQLKARVAAASGQPGAATGGRKRAQRILFG